MRFERSKKIRNLLPPITVKPNINPHDFIKRVYNFLEHSEEFRIELHENFMGEEGLLILNIIPLFKTKHHGLYGQIINNKKIDCENVKIEIRAKRWNPPHPSYDTYVAAAKQIFIPILKKYNKIYATRLRMNIKSARSRESNLSPNVKPLFDSFVISANKDYLNSFDWERFYRFILVAHSSRIKLNGEGLFRLLVKSGFEEYYAREIADVYQHGRALLSIK
ncbi:MAG: hypothetical protein SCARUB_02983 [Candidatus Scalindua rubra]|uniref:Uncharacterized protein n=1 Tax=Candidatus Scalindua rubra TaxID=1872076 RepID=A0A1E3X8F1_9BACT|nr:MAG: hypothetical protein SCARUB_02983 [Candidatus Scalindua rubra]